MGKNNANKRSSFFKKEGIYVILFVCLCVIATVATINTRNSKKVKVQPPVAEQESYTDTKKLKESALSSEENEKTKVDNATQVNKGDDTKTPIAVEKTPSTAVANTKATPSFNQLPVVGSLRQGHSEDPILVENNNSSKQVWRDIKGIYINCKIGQPVVAVEDGIVEKAENNGVEGITVVIKHDNDLKTVYSNLDKDLSVTKDKAVKKGEKIGVVGKTATQYISYSDLTNGFLHFQVLDGDKSVDPAKFGIKYEKSK